VLRDRPNRPRSLDVLFLDARARQALVGVRSLGAAGLSVGAADSPGRGRTPPAFSSRFCAAALETPDACESSESFAAGLISILRGTPSRVVIPSSDATVEVLREHRDKIEGYTAIAQATDPALSVVLDKAKTLAVATEIGVAVPRGESATQAAELREICEEIGFPAVVKPVASWIHASGARGVRVQSSAVCDLREAEHAFAELQEVGCPAALIQQWLPGERQAVTVMVVEGEIRAEFAQVALRTSPALGGSSVLRESIALPPDIGLAARRLLERVGLDGIAEVEFRRDRNGEPVLMEINPRLSASVELAVACGIPFPLLLYSWAAGEPVQKIAGYKTGVRMRWVGGDLAWLLEVWRSQGRPDIPAQSAALRSFVGDFLRPTRYDYLAARDPRPVVPATTQCLKRGLRRGLDKVSMSQIVRQRC